MLWGIPISIVVGGLFMPIGILLYWAANNAFLRIQKKLLGIETLSVGIFTP